MGNISLQILFVEDNPTDVFLLAETLEEVRTSQFGLTHVKRLDEALALLQDKSFDVVLLDLGLPDSQGLETFSRMQREHPTVPILILSGLDDDTLAVRAVQDGAQDFLVKGNINGGVLTRTIRYAIERKRSEQKLITSEAGYRRLFEAAQDGIFLLNAQTGQIEDANPYLAELLGYTRAEFIGKRLWEIGPFRDMAASKAAFATLQETGYIRYDDLPLMAKDGRTINVEFVSNVYDVGDKPVIQCNIRDITQRLQLEKAKHFLASIVESSDDSILTIDFDSIITSWNKAAEHLYGYVAEEVIGKPLTLLTLPVDLQKVLNNIDRIKHSETVEMFDTIRLNKDGREMNLEVALSPVKDGTGQIIGVSTIARDITGRKQTEQALQKSEQEQRQLAEQLEIERSRLITAQRVAKIGSWETDLATMSAIWSNETHRIFKTDPVTYHPTHQDFLELVHPEDRASVDEAFVRSLNQHATCEFEHRVLLPDGRIKFVEERWQVFFDDQGKPVRATGTCQDITERQLADTALHDSNEKFGQLVDNISDVFWIRSADMSQVHYLSPAFERIWGRSVESLYASPHQWTDFILPEDSERVQVAFAGGARDASGMNVEYRIVRPDGEIRWIRVRGFPVRDAAGQVIRHSGIVTDITESKQAEDTIERALQRLTDAQRLGQIGDWELDLATQAITWSPQVFEIVGRDPRLGPPQSYEEFASIYDAASQALLTEKVALVIKSGEPQEYDLVARRPDGEQVEVLARAMPRKDENGRVVSLYGTIQDISQRKKTENSLRRSESLFRALVQNSWNGFQLVQPDGRISYESPAAMRVLGYHPEEMEGRNALEFMHPDDAQAVLEGGQALLELPGSTRTVLLRVRHKDGSWRWLESYEINLLDHPDVGAIAVNYHDITERKAAEEERDRFFTLSLDMLAIIGSDGYMKRLNPAFESTLGFSNAELLASPYIDFVHPDDHGITAQAVARLESGLDITDFESRYRCRDGSYKWLRWTVAPYEELWYCVAHDITGIKQTAAALQKANDELELRVEERTAELGAANEEMYVAKQEADAANHAKSEFLSRMSHELRTPLNAILGFGQILELQSLTPLQSESTGHILKGGRHLLELINEVLNIARIEAGHIDLSLEPIAIGEIIGESLSLIRPLAAQNSIRLDSEEDLVWDGYVMADRQRLKQVFINLLSNAVKYNRNGGRVTITCQEAPEDRLRIHISDTGHGIAEEDLKKLFVPFERLNAAKSEVEGTGLGLVLSLRLTEAMDGTLTVESVQGQGSTFTVELPLTEYPLAEMGLIAASESPVNESTAMDSIFNVLSIEDNASNFRLIETILELRPGIKLEGVTQGSIGLDLARQHHFDLILLDLHLPDIMGHEVLRRLRESPETQNIPVVIISADATAPQIKRLLEAGADAYLTKPLNVKEVLSVIDKALQKRGDDKARKLS